MRRDQLDEERAGFPPFEQAHAQGPGLVERMSGKARRKSVS